MRLQRVKDNVYYVDFSHRNRISRLLVGMAATSFFLTSCFSILARDRPSWDNQENYKIEVNRDLDRKGQL